MDKILVTGACGQLGSELTLALRELYGNDNVIASDVRPADGDLLSGPCIILNAMHKSDIENAIDEHQITQIYHLAAILSAKGENDPKFAWDLNMTSLLNILELARDKKLDKIYWPSSIAVFGPDTPKDDTPQNTIMSPTTVYGISKLAGERWCEYFHNKFGVDVRSLRYPGLIGYKVKPGGGTTDYAVDIFYKALEENKYESFLESDAYLPMMYINDAIKATINLMQANSADVKVRSSYNISAMSFSPEEIANEIKKSLPDFKISYQPDFRQKIASSWPNSIDDSEARKDWNWQHEYDLPKMTLSILKGLKELLNN
ncbi:NAD-dependent epimerase/dehydratase family protein [Fulvivirga sediminis]|uniref:NAD-dependent epimerase/dehydratase family protein n=1 Tax=Fulvivirga sediminis TaxID=2803949 RepID=A0A937F662_9BACT|nr:NAD-dependent epimerase/dehydratase family protein [Fulvivirga sediminis]MBL3655035.1 NAD-dependent epimerase/dehydratase family protein [Fulvivirga sediminis]